MSNIWTALRFILVAVPGVLIFLAASGYILVWMFDPVHTPNPALAGLLGFVGLLMSLYGTGRWGQWRNLYTIASIPVIVFVLITLIAGGKDEAFIATVIALPLLLFISYRIRRKRTEQEK